MCGIYSCIFRIAWEKRSVFAISRHISTLWLREGFFLSLSPSLFSLAHRCDPLSPWAAGLERCMPVPAVPAPPFSEARAPGCGVSSTTTPILWVLPSPPLSHQTRACELQHGLSWRNPLPPPPRPRTFGTENRRAYWITTNRIKILPSRCPYSSLNVAPAGWCLLVLFDIVIWLANYLWGIIQWTETSGLGCALLCSALLSSLLFCSVGTPRIPDCSDMGRMKYRIGDISVLWHTACP